MSRTPSSHRTCSCGCTVRETPVRPSVAIRPAPRPPGTVDSAARRRPVVRGCRCHLCCPAQSRRGLDAIDATVIRNVRARGWHVTAVGAGGSGAPAFAYTVGLGHRTGHPELVMSGQPIDLMAAVLNDVAHRIVVDGQRLEPGSVVEGALAWHPMVADEVASPAVGELVTYASWFHRRPARALQLVWPDAYGIFPWQPGADDTSDLQPPAWRTASARIGGVSADPDWVLDTPPEAKAVACTHVVLDGRCPTTALRVRAAAGDDVWLLLCDRDDAGHTDDDYSPLHLSHAVRGTPSLRELADLRVGEGATRRGPGHAWRRFALA